MSMLEAFKFKLQYYDKDIDLYALLCNNKNIKSNNQIITWNKSNLCNDSIGFNYQLGYYASLQNKFDKNFMSFKIKTLGIDTKRGGWTLKIFQKTIYKFGYTIDLNSKIIMHKEKNLKVLLQYKKFKG